VVLSHNSINVSRDMTTGITSPFDPSMNLENDQTFTKRGSIWQEKNVSVVSAQLKQSVIGSHATVGDGAVITNSIIGRNCKISPGAIIQDSILWNDITVNRGVKINRSIVAANNIIPTNCQINGGVIIPPNSIISDENIAESKSFTVYGKPPKEPSQDVFQDDSDSDEPIPICKSHLMTQLIPASLNLTDSEISEIGSDSDSEDDHSSHRRRRSSASGVSIASTHNEFYDEAEESLARAFLENHSVENATIELKTLRMATNVTFHEVREAIVWALMNILIHQPKRVETIFGKWGALLSAFTEDRAAQVDIVFIVQHYFGRVIREGVIADRRRFVLGLQRLYEADVLEEGSILRWAEDKRASGVGEKWSEDMAALRKSADGFITWLKEAEEESDEE
jgi:translation initiation factor eIF-2B subunit epsilon